MRPIDEEDESRGFLDLSEQMCGYLAIYFLSEICFWNARFEFFYADDGSLDLGDTWQDAPPPFFQIAELFSIYREYFFIRQTWQLWCDIWHKAGSFDRHLLVGGKERFRPIFFNTWGFSADPCKAKCVQETIGRCGKIGQLTTCGV